MCSIIVQSKLAKLAFLARTVYSLAFPVVNHIQWWWGALLCVLVLTGKSSETKNWKLHKLWQPIKTLICPKGQPANQRLVNQSSINHTLRFFLFFIFGKFLLCTPHPWKTSNNSEDVKAPIRWQTRSTQTCNLQRVHGCCILSTNESEMHSSIPQAWNAYWLHKMYVYLLAALSYQVLHTGAD